MREGRMRGERERKEGRGKKGGRKSRKFTGE